MKRGFVTGSVYRLCLTIWLSFTVLFPIPFAGVVAESRQTTTAPLRRALKEIQEIELRRFYEAHQWFKLHDAVKGKRAPAFYRGAVAYAFNDVEQAESNLRSVIESAPQAAESSDARTMLINLYMRAGRYTRALAEAEEELRASPGDAALKNASALLGTLSQSPEQVVSRRRPSKIRYTTREGNLFIPVNINGRQATYILDTGANYSIISEAEAKRLGLTLLQSGVHKIEGSSGDEVDFRVAIADRLEVGEFSLRHVAFLVLADTQQPFPGLQPGERGVIGLPVILAFQTIRWRQDGTFEFGFAPGRRGRAESRLCFDGMMPLIEGAFRQNKINIFLDTGATRTRVLPLFAKEFSSFVNGFGQKDSDRVTGVSGSVEVEALKLPELKLRVGGLDTRLRPAPVLLKETKSDTRWWHVWMGMDLLNRAHVVTLDFTSMTFALE